MFAGMGAKNYAYDTHKAATGERSKRVVHVRGLTLSGEAEEQMNMQLKRSSRGSQLLS